VCTDENVDVVESLVLITFLIKQNDMNRHVKLNVIIIFRSILMLGSKVEQIIAKPLENMDHQTWHVFLRHSAVSFSLLFSIVTDLKLL